MYSRMLWIFNKTNISHGGSYVYSPEQINDKKATTNRKNNE